MEGWGGTSDPPSQDELRQRERMGELENRVAELERAMRDVSKNLMRKK